MADALEIQNSEELNTTSDSEFNGFMESDILDMGDDTIVADNSGMSDNESTTSSSDEQETEEEEEVDNGYGDYRDDLIDEVIDQQLERNPPNWSLNNYQDFREPDYTRPPDNQIYLLILTFLLQRLLIIFLCISHNNYLKIWFSIQVTMHDTSY